MPGAPRYERDTGDRFGVWQDLCETIEFEQRLLEKRFAAFAEALR